MSKTAGLVGLESLDVLISIEYCISNIREYQQKKFRKHMDFMNSKNRIWKFFFGDAYRLRFLEDDKHLEDLELLYQIGTLCNTAEIVYLNYNEVLLLQKWGNKDEV